MNKIALSFSKSLSNLAGYEFGLSTFKEQVKGNIDLRKEFFIEFPPEIKGVASSFVQGFFEEIVEEIGLLATEQRAKIISLNSNIQENLLRKLQ